MKFSIGVVHFKTKLFVYKFAGLFLLNVYVNPDTYCNCTRQIVVERCVADTFVLRVSFLHDVTLPSR